MSVVFIQQTMILCLIWLTTNSFIVFGLHNDGSVKCICKIVMYTAGPSPEQKAEFYSLDIFNFHDHIFYLICDSSDYNVIPL